MTFAFVYHLHFCCISKWVFVFVKFSWKYDTHCSDCKTGVGVWGTSLCKTHFTFFSFGFQTCWTWGFVTRFQLCWFFGTVLYAKFYMETKRCWITHKTNLLCDLLFLELLTKARFLLGVKAGVEFEREKGPYWVRRRSARKPWLLHVLNFYTTVLRRQLARNVLRRLW